jgi:hypothetical protein
MYSAVDENMRVSKSQKVSAGLWHCDTHVGCEREDIKIGIALRCPPIGLK